MFLDIVSRYIAERYVRFENGQIWFGKERVTFNFLPILAKEFLMNNEISGGRYAAAMFLSGRREGYDFVRQHGIPLVKNWTPVLRMGFQWINLFGVGMFRPIKANNEQGFMIAAGRSTFGLEMKSESPGRNKPVDFVMGGLIAGAIQYYTKKPTYAVETTCVAEKNVRECVLVAGGRKDILKYIKDFSPDKVSWANTTLDQVEAVEKEIKEIGDKRWLV